MLITLIISLVLNFILFILLLTGAYKLDLLEIHIDELESRDIFDNGNGTGHPGEAVTTLGYGPRPIDFGLGFEGPESIVELIEDVPRGTPGTPAESFANQSEKPVPAKHTYNGHSLPYTDPVSGWTYTEPVHKTGDGLVFTSIPHFYNPSDSANYVPYPIPTNAKNLTDFYALLFLKYPHANGNGALTEELVKSYGACHTCGKSTEQLEIDILAANERLKNEIIAEGISVPSGYEIKSIITNTKGGVSIHSVEKENA